MLPAQQQRQLRRPVLVVGHDRLEFLKEFLPDRLLQFFMFVGSLPFWVLLLKQLLVAFFEVGS